MNKITKTQSNAAEGWIALLSDWRTFRAKQIPNKTGKKKFNILLANPKFVDAVFKLRRRDEFVIPPQGFQYEEAAIDWAKKLFSRNKDRVLFETVITKLLHKFRATDRWRSIIEFFILFNTTNFDHLIHIDASHAYKHVFADIETSYTLFPDAVICGHDAFYHEVKKAVEDFCGKHELKSTSEKDIFVIYKKT